MKHLRKFNEALDYSKVDPDSEEYSEGYVDIAESYVHQVERATGKKVIDIYGVSGEGTIDLTIEIEGGDSVEIQYEYSPYVGYSSALGREVGFVEVIYTTRDGESLSKKDTDEDVKDMLDAGEDVYVLVKFILAELNPSYVIQLPRETAETSGYHYDIDNKSRGYMMIDVEFESLDDVENWIESLYDKIKKKVKN